MVKLTWLGRLLGRRPPPAPSVTPAQWWLAEARLPFLGRLSPADRERLRTLAVAFLRGKEFHGAQGFHLTDEVMLAIALQACLPVLKLGLEAYRGWVGIVVYPGDFLIPRQEMDEAGVVHEYDDPVLGEAWEGGPVLLSWFDDPAATPGVNVVIHEFVHKLDMTNGAVDGIPALPPEIRREEWIRVLDGAYADHCAAVDRGEDTLLDPYGSQDKGEFFAVASEAFFLCPVELREAMPALYGLLARYYRLDPAASP
ncbi:MAG: zinc-dependent peptidase [Rhodocyclaceae bacterium]|jgi:Mlc titration factor MtfA (ptsG expression regulator)|nr:zinc-dependent peptidase [Rhodocyclaceae bacterium]